MIGCPNLGWDFPSPLPKSNFSRPGFDKELFSLLTGRLNPPKVLFLPWSGMQVGRGTPWIILYSNGWSKPVTSLRRKLNPSSGYDASISRLLDCLRRRKKPANSWPMTCRMLMKRWSTGSWPPLISESAWPSRGWTWLATPTPMATRAMSGPASGPSAIGSSGPLTKTSPMTNSSVGNSPAT